MKTLTESINRMRVLAGLHEALRTELKEITENQLSPEEQQVVADLTSLNEADEQGWMAKLKQYAQKGLLTASVIAALLAAPNLSQAQKSEVKALTSGAQTTASVDKPGHTLPVRTLSTQERYDWNAFVDFLEAQGMKESPKMDVKSMDLGRKMMDQFKKLNPHTTLNYDLIPSIQDEMQKVQKFNADFFNRKGDTATAQNIIQGLSKLDGWLGSKTSAFKFPNVELNKTTPDGKTILSKDQGLLKGNGATTKNDQSKFGIAKPVPKGAEVWKDKDGKVYFTDANGDAVLAAGY